MSDIQKFINGLVYIKEHNSEQDNTDSLDLGSDYLKLPDTDLAEFVIDSDENSVGTLLNVLGLTWAQNPGDNSVWILYPTDSVENGDALSVNELLSKIRDLSSSLKFLTDHAKNLAMALTGLTKSVKENISNHTVDKHLGSIFKDLIVYYETCVCTRMKNIYHPIAKDVIYLCASHSDTILNVPDIDIPVSKLSKDATGVLNIVDNDIELYNTISKSKINDIAKV